MSKKKKKKKKKKKVLPSKILAAAKELKGVAVGNFEFVKDELKVFKSLQVFVVDSNLRLLN